MNFPDNFSIELVLQRRSAPLSATSENCRIIMEILTLSESTFAKVTSARLTTGTTITYSACYAER